MLGRYLKENVVPKVMQDSGMICWLLHFARELRAICSHLPGGPTIPASTIPFPNSKRQQTRLRRRSMALIPSSSARDGAQRLEHQCVAAATKVMAAADVSASLQTLFCVQVANRGAPSKVTSKPATATPPTRPKSSVPKPSTPTTTSKPGPSGKALLCSVDLRQAPKSKPTIDSYLDELADDTNDKTTIDNGDGDDEDEGDDDDIVPPTNPRDHSVGPGAEVEDSEYDDSIDDEPKQMTLDQSDDMVDAFELVRRFAPDHVVGLWKVSPRYPQNFWGMHLLQRGDPDCLAEGKMPKDKDNSLLWYSRQNSDSALKVLPMIAEE
jgi:hypothetical protein